MELWLVDRESGALWVWTGCSTRVKREEILKEWYVWCDIYIASVLSFLQQVEHAQGVIAEDV